MQMKTDTDVTPTTSLPVDGRSKWLDVVQNNVESLRFGVVQIIVHDSKVVQIERTEKTRLDRSCAC